MSSWPSFSMYIGRPSYVCVLGECELEEGWMGMTNLVHLVVVLWIVFVHEGFLLKVKVPGRE